MNNKINIILPTLNEEEGITNVVKRLKRQAVDRIIVVDGHSKDRTVAIARKLGCQVIMQEGGKGKGYGFQTFLKRHRIKGNDIYVMLDADGTYPPEAIRDMIRPIMENRADVVIGQRRNKGESMTLLHILGNSIISLIGFLLYGFWADICTGYWVFKGSALNELDIDAKRFELEANLFAESLKKGFRVVTVPFEYQKRFGLAKLRATDAVSIILKLVTARFG